MLLAFFAGGVSPTWADKVVLSEGFESNSLATNGWTTSNPGGSAITTSAKNNGSYGYQFNYYSSGGARYLISPELSIPQTASDISLSFYYKKYSGSYTEKFKVGYSTTTNDLSNFTWGDEVNDATTSEFKEYTNTSLPSGTKYIAIQYCSGDAYYLYIDDISLTCKISGPALSVADGTANIASGYSYSFGLATASTKKVFTLSNPGTEAAPISVSHTGSFGAELSANSIPAGESVTLTVTMPDATGSDVITISSTSDAIEDFAINVSGTIKDPNKLWCNFSEGVPSTWTNGGVTVSTTGASSYAGSSEGGYVYDSGYGYTLTTPLLEFDGSEKMHFLALRTQSSASYCELKAEYSANGTSGWNTLTVSKAVSDISYYYSATSWTPVEVSGIPAGSYYIRFTPKYVRITDIYGGTESTAPIIALSQNSYDFGLISTSTTTATPITITNTGKSALTGMTITSDNANFTVAVADDATSIAANDGTATFTVTMAPNATGAQSATITIKSDNADDLTFTVTGAVAKAGTTTVDFNDNALPAGWSNSTSYYWTFADGVAYAGSGSSYSGYPTLTTPKVSVATDDFLSIKVKAYSSSYGYLKIYTSTDGTTFSSTAFKEISYSELATSDYKTIIVDGLTSDIKAFRFVGYYVYVDEIAGLTYAPVLTVKKGDDVQTTPAAHTFGEVGADQTVTYNFNNTGAGTINITNVTSSNAVFTTNWTESVAASDYNLVITANYDADKAGEQNGAITVTTTEGAFVINLTSTFLAADAPKFAVLVGETEQTTGADLGFGVITANTTKEFVIKNDGTGALNVTAITLPDDDYTTDLTTAPTSEAPLVVAAGTTKTIKVTLAASAKAIKSSKSIVISATGFDDFTFAADATILVGTETVDFATAIPSTWDNESNGWSIESGAAKCIGKKNLTTSKLQFGENDFFVFKVKASDSGSGDYVTVEGSADNGSTWTAFDKKTYSYSGDFGSSTGDYSTIVVSVPSTVNKLRFNGYFVLIDEIAGLTYDANDPKLGIYTDAECTVAAATSVTKDFGFVTADATATYYIKNDGTGTMTLALGDAPAGFTQNLDKTSVAAGEKATLTITMPATNKGYHSGNVVVTATDLGTFTVAATGVVVDPSKNYVNFAPSSSAIPAGWTANNWTYNASNDNSYIYSSASSTELVTTKMIIADDEKLIITAAKRSIGYYDTTPSLTISYLDDESAWQTAQTINNADMQISPWKTYEISGIPASATGRQIKFTGVNVYIQRIYGFTAVTEPIMTTTAADIAFGMQTEESAEQTFNITNEGTAVLEGLSVTLGKTGDAAEYSVALYDGENAFTGTELTAGKTITVKVKQLFNINNLGAKSDVLTITATGQTPVTINLTGATRDGSKMYVDFEDGNIPTGWTANTWSVTTSSGNKVAYAGFTASSLITTPLTVAENEVLTFKAARQYSSSAPTLQVRYTTNGGVTWSEYQDFASQVTSSDFATITLSGVPAGTAVVEIYGRYFYLDEIAGFKATTAPMIALTESSTAVANSSTKEFGTLTAEVTATYTLKNIGTAAMVSTVATTGVATAAITGEGEGVTIADNKVTLAAGKSATITLTLPFAAPYGEKSGAMTITSEGWVDNFTVNYTATTVDPTALYVDFTDDSKPNGWYNNGWSFTSGYGYAYNYNSTNAEFITQKLTVSGTDDAMTYQVAKYSNYSSSAALAVEYSTDRKNWTAAAVQPSDLTTDFKSFTLSGLAAGNYYVKFTGAQVKLDNIQGWHYATPAAAHDLYLASATLPTETVVPGTEYTATVNVASLRANETVKAELYFGETKVGELSEDASISNGETKTIAVKGNVPATETDYDVYVKVYNANVNVETEKVSVVAAHTRTLSIASFTRTDGTEGLTADENNKISPAFSVTVENTGTTACTPTVKIYQGETVVATATADAAVAAGETSDAIALTATNMSAGEGGALEFTAKAFWTAEDTEAKATSDAITINVTATAPKFALYDSENTEITDGTSYDLGIIKGTKSLNFTVKNEGNAPMLIKSITTPDGYTLPTTVQAFIAAQQAVPAMEGYNAVPVVVNLTATDGDYGKKVGDLVVTYKVDGSTDKTFTLHLSGRTVADDTWVEEFATNIPASWTNNGWEWNSDRKAAYSTYTKGKLLMTPRLAAEKDEVLTFDVIFPYSGEQLKVQYSTDKTIWNDVNTYNSTANDQIFEGSFTAPATGNYYLRFGDANSRYAYIDNLVGFKLNIPEHDTEIAASSVPTTGTQYADYTATVTLKENVGKAEDVTVKLFVNGAEVTENMTVDKTSIDANASTVVTLTWEPQAVISTAVKAYLKVTYAGGDLTTDEVDLTIAAPYELDETMGDVANASYPALVLKHSFVAGWNTICLPFTINVTDIHAEAKAFSFDAYDEGTKALTFNKATELAASVPYVIYVPEAISVENPFIFKNVEIGIGYTTPDKSEHTMTFQGTYAPMAAGSLTDCCGLTAAGKIVKAKSTTTMKGFRGYFKNVPAGARVMFNGFEDDETTGIRMITIDNTAAEGTFNLQGQKVEQLKKGRLYIINGKKQVVK